MATKAVQTHSSNVPQFPMAEISDELRQRNGMRNYDSSDGMFFTPFVPANLSIERIEGLLTEAADAHHAFEAATGKPDVAWQKWYAAYIFGVLAGKVA